MNVSYILYDCKNIRLLYDEVFLVFEGNLGACVFAVEHFVADLDLHRFIFLSGTCSYNFTLLRFLFRCVRNVNA